MKWTILLSAALIATACSNNSTNLGTKTSSLKVDISTEALGSGSTTKAGVVKDGAPVYVKGVTLTATNTEYSETNTQTFYFADAPEGKSVTPEDAIEMVNLKVGETTVAADGIAANDALNKGYFYANNVITTNQDDLADRSADYARYFVETENHGVYARYASVEDANDDNVNDGLVVISNNSSKNNVALQMDTEDHRLNIVLENPTTSLYDLEMRVYEQGNSTPLFNSKTKAAAGNDNLLDQGQQVAFVINNELATGDKTYVLEVDYYTTDTHILMEGRTISKTIAIEATTYTTKLYRFKKENLLEGNSSINFTWKWLEETNTGEDLTDE